ncbi:hypothetical protein [Streptomyces sp. enrichment culture]|uniref:hypothetical protein n=1 Tax=Streptomyces sp. enrichment culture TaxID=1795815 RepID=UPI003F5614AF
MARMRRGLVHALAWSLATGGSVTLSWWGVHTVMSGTVYDRPSALPLTSAGPPPQAASTSRPRPPAPSSPSGNASPSTPPSASPSAPRPAPPAPSATRAPDPSRTPSPSAPASSGKVRSYVVDGGRTAFSLGERSAELVSATPAPGWQMQVWKAEGWLRVTFTRDDLEISVFCVWHDSPPRVEIDERRT